MSQFAYRGSPTTQSAVSSAASSSPPPSAMAVTSSHPPGARSASPRGSPLATASSAGQGPRCCDTGRPLFTDPLTGQTVCSCQYDLLNYQRLAASGMAPGGVPLSMYSAPYSDAAAAGMAAYFPALGADQAPFYTNPGGIDLKENLAGASPWPYPSVYHPYDTAFAGYPFNGYGMDLNGARRKNATRETTSTLKAWLNEHKKNPYPTKGEKIMLAIITKMTLTQVSTWFANARRRLKKENKMTWEPRNRVEDEDNNNDDDDRKSADGKDIIDSKDSGTGSSEDGDRPHHHRLDLDRPADNGSEWSEGRADSGPDSPDILFERPPHPAHLIHQATYHLSHPVRPSPPSPPPATVSGTPTTGKPRIWSLADMASKDSGHNTSSGNSAFYSTAGKLVSPLANRGLHPLHSPYVRPEFYRSFYNPAAASPENMALLESYSRTFGATLAHNGLNPLTSSLISKASGSGFSIGPGASGLTTAASGPSPASSTSSLTDALGPSGVEGKPVAANKA